MANRLAKGLLEVARTSPGEVALVVLALAAVASGSFYVYGKSANADPPPIVRSTKAPKVEEIVVHVSGHVAKPGVYRLSRGSRVHEAIDLAGGAAPDADLDAINLAGVLADGEKVHVTRRGDPAAGGETAAGPSRVNLNTADVGQLEQLPGVGPVLAQRIIEHRQRRGRFTSVRDLLQVEGVGPKKFEALKDLVIV